jgi:Vacuolar sorting-associated protein 13, N-terminal
VEHMSIAEVRLSLLPSGGLQITIAEPHLRLSCRQVFEVHDPHMRCNASQLRRFLKLLHSPARLRRLGGMHTLVQWLLRRVTVTVEDTSVRLTCGGPLTSSTDNALEVCVDMQRLSMDLPHRTSGNQLSQPRLHRSANHSRDVHARNICVACLCNSTRRFRVINRWGFAVSVKRARTTDVQAITPRIELSVQANALMLTMDNAAVPSIMNVLSYIQQHLTFAAVRAHRPRSAIRDDVIAWWQHAAKSVIQCMRGRRSNVSVACLRHLPRLMKAYQQAGSSGILCPTGAFWTK